GVLSWIAAKTTERAIRVAVMETSSAVEPFTTPPHPTRDTCKLLLEHSCPLAASFHGESSTRGAEGSRTLHLERKSIRVTLIPARCIFPLHAGPRGPPPPLAFRRRSPRSR